jgi:hypothetical protein
MAQSADVETRTYSLTPEQFRRFMDGMPDLASFVHLDAVRQGDDTYSTGSIVRGANGDEREGRGFSMRPEDSVASLRRHFDRGGHTTGYSIRTDDPAIQARLRQAGIPGQTDEERLRPVREEMQRIYRSIMGEPGGTHSRTFERPPTSEDLARLFNANSTAVRPPVYELTPEQFRQLMGRDDMRGLMTMDDLVARVDAGGSFSRVYIQPSGPVGRGAVGTAEVRFNQFTHRPERYVLSTSDPRLARALGEMGIQPTAPARFPQTKEIADLSNQPGTRPPQAEGR